MQSRAEGLMFWLSPTCFWRTQYSFILQWFSPSKKKILQTMIEFKIHSDAEPTLETYAIS